MPSPAPAAFLAALREPLSAGDDMAKLNPMQDNPLRIGRKLVWSSTVLAVEPYTDRDSHRGDFNTPEGTQAWLVTTSGTSLSPLSPKDFEQFGFTHLAEDNVALNPYHFPRKADNSYTFAVEEAPGNASTRDGATARATLFYVSGGKRKFMNLVADPDTLFALVNPRSQSAPSPANQAAQPASSEREPEPDQPTTRTRSRRGDNSGPGPGLGSGG
jgi:hypothetical protein